MGEIRFEDGTSMLVPQPTRDLWVTLDEAYLTSLPELPAPEVVEEYVAKHPHSNAKPQTYPVWAVVCLWVGGLLSVGTGAFLITMWWLAR
jgi:hypothetical protein